MNVLRVYDPAECDGHGVPLDWEECRTCKGGKVVDGSRTEQWDIRTKCPICDGHGSLKAAALAHLAQKQMWAEVERIGAIKWPDGGAETKAVLALRHEVEASLIVRCDGCSHPMGGGTWDPGGDRPWDFDSRMRGAFFSLQEGMDPSTNCPPDWPVYYSPCDEGCRHDGPGRMPFDAKDPLGGWIGCNELMNNVGITEGFEASWRPVDVRTLGWPHDLRPERLAVLCLRCWAALYPSYRWPSRSAD